MSTCKSSKLDNVQLGRVKMKEGFKMLEGVGFKEQAAKMFHQASC